MEFNAEPVFTWRIYVNLASATCYVCNLRFILFFCKLNDVFFASIFLRLLPHSAFLPLIFICHDFKPTNNLSFRASPKNPLQISSFCNSISNTFRPISTFGRAKKVPNAIHTYRSKVSAEGAIKINLPPAQTKQDDTGQSKSNWLQGVRIGGDTSVPSIYWPQSLFVGPTNCQVDSCGYRVLGFGGGSVGIGQELVRCFVAKFQFIQMLR